MLNADLAILHAEIEFCSGVSHAFIVFGSDRSQARAGRLSCEAFQDFLVTNLSE